MRAQVLIFEEVQIWSYLLNNLAPAGLWPLHFEQESTELIRKLQQDFKN